MQYAMVNDLVLRSFDSIRCSEDDANNWVPDLFPSLNGSCVAGMNCHEVPSFFHFETMLLKSPSTLRQMPVG